MLLRSWVEHLKSTCGFGLGGRTFNRRPRRKPTTGRRLQVEALEDRFVLSGGVLDPTFGTGGLVTTAFGSYARAFAVATYPNEGTANDGKIVAAGDAYSSTGKTSTEYVAVVRYNLDGTLDRTFGGNGEVMTTPGFALAVQVQPDGKVLAAGSSGGQFAVVRYNSDGTLDNSFGSKGKVVTSISRNSTDFIEAMVLQADGKIVVAGETTPKSANHADFALARYNANGSLDTNFGTGGKVTRHFVSPIGTIGGGMVNLAIDSTTNPLDPNPGKIVAVTRLQDGSEVVVRYNANGSPDTSFGGTGDETIGNVIDVSAPSVALQTDGRIVVADTANSISGHYEIILDRLNPNGTPDATFGSGGLVVVAPPSNDPSDNYIARSVAIQSDGKIVVGGGEVTGDLISAQNFLVARLNAADGSVDTSFGVNGVAITSGLLINNFRIGMALEPDGRIVLAGSTSAAGGVFNFALARFLATGPQIGSFTASPNPVTAGSSATLTAANITDGNLNSTITQAALYVDSNGDGKLEAGADTLLGYATQTSPGIWTFIFTDNLAPGAYTLFAQAEDSYGVFGDPLASTLTVN